jgi:hypothetical protein
MIRTKVAVLVAFAALGVTQAANAANLIVNGGFEAPVQGPPNYAAFNVPAGSTLITGWTIVQGNVDLTTTVNYGPGLNTLNPASVQDIDLVGDSFGSNGVFGGLSQSFSTVAGQIYQLTFDYSHNNGTFSSNGYAAQVTVANGLADAILSAEVSQAYGQSPWTAFSQTFTATSDLTTLTFINTRGGYNAGIYLDDVSVEALAAGVPEPATWGMMLLGFGLLGVAMRRGRDVLATVSYARSSN